MKTVQKAENVSAGSKTRSRSISHRLRGTIYTEGFPTVFDPRQNISAFMAGANINMFCTIGLTSIFFLVFKP